LEGGEVQVEGSAGVDGGRELAPGFDGKESSGLFEERRNVLAGEDAAKLFGGEVLAGDGIGVPTTDANEPLRGGHFQLRVHGSPLSVSTASRGLRVMPGKALEIIFVHEN
jgi:hypothetical protein